jgi:hypothetical protein
MRTAAPANPDPLAITQLVGASVMPGMPASMESLIGRIRGSLGS